MSMSKTLIARYEKWLDLGTDRKLDKHLRIRILRDVVREHIAKSCISVHNLRSLRGPSYTVVKDTGHAVFDFLLESGKWGCASLLTGPHKEFRTYDAAMLAALDKLAEEKR